MSLNTKLAMIFSIIVSFILIINNFLSYMYTKDFLIKEVERQMQMLADQVHLSISFSQSAESQIEALLGEKLYFAALSAKERLDPKIQNVTNEQLVNLSKKLAVSHITLFSKVGDDIRALKSSDPAEINLSMNQIGGIWFPALKQLMDQKEVTFEGQKLPHYWSGSMEVSSSNSNHVDKWGYYYDGTTDYIIDPYIRGTNFTGFRKFEGTQMVIQQTLKTNGDLLEITGFNPEAFGKEAIYSYDKKGKTFIYLSDQPILFGSYIYNNEGKDKQTIQQTLQTKRVITMKIHSEGKEVIKSFIPVFGKTDPYVIGVVTDYQPIKALLIQHIKNNVFISVIMITIVFCLSYMFARYIMKPINYILDKVNQIANGNFGENILLHRKDELGNLAISINTMSTNLKNYTEQVEHLAYHDQLTGLPNRHCYTKKLDEILDEAKMKQQTVGLLFFDLDRFKLINDLYGHSFADLLLKTLADRLKTKIRGKDIVARFGGDEFSAVIPNSSPDEIEKIAERLLEICTAPFVIQGQEIHITLSIGISLFPKDGENQKILMKNADSAMYTAKENGRNNVNFFDSNNLNSRMVVLEQDLHKAYKNKEFFIEYQPQVNVENEQIVGVEALIRWQHPKLGLISPSEFIPLAEKSGLIIKIGDWVLEAVCEQYKRWRENGLPPIRMAVNLSALQFQHDRLIEKISKTIQEFKIEPQYLELEFTESIAMKNTEYVIGKLNQLKKLGVKIALDDFGSGYSSLSNLKRLPVDTLKIDKSFIDDIDTDSFDAAIVRYIIRLAKSLNLNVIAEGIENENQSKFLKEEKDIEAQGYFYSKPLSVEKCEHLLNQLSATKLRL